MEACVRACVRVCVCREGTSVSTQNENLTYPPIPPHPHPTPFQEKNKLEAAKKCVSDEAKEKRLDSGKLKSMLYQCNNPLRIVTVWSRSADDDVTKS